MLLFIHAAVFAFKARADALPEEAKTMEIFGHVNRYFETGVARLLYVDPVAASR